jgi:NAD(P)H-hydrate repair Nnr-like enzyme with NAD(P)H-hydrate dehydratase domain
MHETYWHKQASGRPLFPDLLWSRPETQARAGKLLIIGGHAHEFAAPAAAYQAAQQAGIGTAQVLLPNAIRTHFSSLRGQSSKYELPVEFAASTPSGSFGRQALGEFLALASWADGVLLAGDLGRNSETAILLESFASKYSGQLTITRDALDYFLANPSALLARPETTLVPSFAQLQKLATASKFPQAFSSKMALLQLVETLHDFSQTLAASLITRHQDTMLVAASGQVSTTKLANPPKIWRVTTAASASVWRLQNPSKPFEALTTSLAEF